MKSKDKLIQKKIQNITLKRIRNKSNIKTKCKWMKLKKLLT